VGLNTALHAPEPTTVPSLSMYEQSHSVGNFLVTAHIFALKYSRLDFTIKYEVEVIFIKKNLPIHIDILPWSWWVCVL